MMKAAVIGWPIAHSRSPQIHNFWLKTYGIDGLYEKIAVAPEDLAFKIEELIAAGYHGLNVTIPHKENILPLADKVSDAARAIGAANTLVFEGGKIHATNTDGYGFLKNLQDHSPDLGALARPVFVFGAGGAARSILYSLLKAGAPKIFLYNRTAQKAHGLAQEFGTKIQVVSSDDRDDALRESGLLVNTTAMGMGGKNNLSLPLELMPKEALVYDIVYTPLKTGLLEEAEKQNLKTIDGLGMLLYQAVPGFESWFGKKPEVTKTLRDAALK